MAQFDVYRLRDGGFVLDCQNEILDDIGTRFVVPLVPIGEGAPQSARLNPTVSIRGEDMTMITQFATTIRTVELRDQIMSLAKDRYRIIDAIDALVGSG